MLTELLEKFEDVFQSATPEDVTVRLEKMDQEELSSFIIEDVLDGLGTYEWQEVLLQAGAFDDRDIDDKLTYWIEEHVSRLDKEELLEFLNIVKVAKVKVKGLR